MNMIKKMFATVMVSIFIVGEVLAAQSSISVKPTYTPSLGNPVPKQTIVGHSKPLGRHIGGYFPMYGGVYYSGVRYTSRRERQLAAQPPAPQVVQVQLVTPTPAVAAAAPITSCNGISYYDKAGNIIRCR